MLTPFGGLILITLWPLLCIFFMNTMPLNRGILWSIFIGFMFLPVGISFDPPLLPAIDKVAAPSIGVFIGLLLIGKRPYSLKFGSTIIKILLFIIILQPFITAIMNSNTANIGLATKPGLSLYDAVSSAMRHYIIIIPFLVAYKFIRNTDDHENFVKVIFISGMIYSVLMIIELRFSPRMNIWIYGYFQHSWAQMLRDGGYRPIVFLNHGLWVAFFAMTTLISAAIIWKNLIGKQKRFQFFICMIYLSIILIFCKSLGSILFATIILPLIIFTNTRLQVKISAILAIVAMLYPALRGANLVPIQNIISVARNIDEKRARSLEFRINNENLLLEHANKKPIFGWGGRGRNLIYENEGRKAIVVDGYWIIVIGQHGWFGYIAHFGLLGVPILLLYRRTRRGFDVDRVTSGLSLILAVNMIELLPNATLMPWTWLLAGAILGRSEAPEGCTVAVNTKSARLVSRKRTVL